MKQLLDLWRTNRSAAYYRNTVATAAQADTMLLLAEELHRPIRDFAQATHAYGLHETYRLPLGIPAVAVVHA